MSSIRRPAGRGRSLALIVGLASSVALAVLLGGLAVRGTSSGVRPLPAAADSPVARSGPGERKSVARPHAQARVEKSCQKGMAVSWRLVEQGGGGGSDGPRIQSSSFESALSQLKSWWRIAPDPYARGLGKAGPYVVGLARPDVDGFIAGRAPPVGRSDPGPSSGLAEAMTSVLLPPPGRFQVDLMLPAGKVRFETWAGVVPRGRAGKVRFSFDVTLVGGDSKGTAAPGVESGAAHSSGATTSRPIHEEVELVRARGRWIPVTMDLSPFAGKRVRISVTTSGPPGVPMFLADPRLLSETCLPGHNIMLVVIDTMRADAFDLLSGRKGVTPNLDALAARGVSFDESRSLGTWTRPSMTAIFASDWANRLGVSRTRFRLTDEQRRSIHGKIRPRLSSLELRRRGYFTEAVGNNFFFLEHTPLGLDRGFERVVDIRGRGGKDSLAVVAELERFLAHHKNVPFFVWVHLDGSHWPYVPPKGYSVRGARAAGAPRDRAFEDYLGEVRWSDEILGKILAALKTNGLTDRTLVAVTADHGETFADAHSFTMAHIKTRHNHGWSVYEELLHVPLVMAGPGVPKGVRVEPAVSHLHLLPTLFDYAGLGKMPGAVGRSLRPVIEHPDGKAPGWLWPIVSEGRRMEAICQGRYKYIRRWGFVTRIRRAGHSETRRDELYDLEKDPLETKNLASRFPDLVQRLRKKMAEILEAKDGTGPGAVAGAGPSDPGTKAGRPEAVALHLGIWAPDVKNDPVHRLRAKVTSGCPLSIETVGPGGRVRWEGRGAVEMDLPSVPGRLVEASVVLSCRRASLHMTLDGHRLDASKLRVGPYGLNLFARYDVIDEAAIVAAEAPFGPIDPKSQTVACFLWTSRGPVKGAKELGGWNVGRPGPAGGGARSVRGPGAHQVDRLLQQWGYSKDH